MQSANCQQATQIIESAKQQVLEYLPLDNTWKLDSDSKGLKCYLRKETKSELNMSRNSVTINKPISVVSDHFNTISEIAQSDSTVIESKVIEQFDNDFFIGYISNKGLPGIDNRDLCFAQRKFVEGDRIIFIRGDFEHPSAPVPKGFTRAKTLFGGFVLTKIDENTTDVVFMMLVDPSGSIPNMIKNSLASKSKDKLKLIKEFVEKK